MKWIKGLLASVVTFILLLVALYVFTNEPLPVGIKGEKAERLADKMLEAINHDAWEKTGAIEWRSRHNHLWDKKRHYAQVGWGDYIVQIDINKRKGVVLKGTTSDDTEVLSAICLKAWKYWANDSFWLNPISKIRDAGTSRAVVMYEGEEALMVSYDQGGVTPGDSYLWFLSDSGLPYKWKMWVSILPIGGVSTSWEDWLELNSGAKIATTHKNMLTLKLTDIRAAESINKLKKIDVFISLENPTSMVVDF